jgi:hypothetical protein
MMDSRSSIITVFFWVYAVTTSATAGDLHETVVYSAKFRPPDLD